MLGPEVPLELPPGQQCRVRLELFAPGQGVQRFTLALLGPQRTMLSRTTILVVADTVGWITPERIDFGYLTRSQRATRRLHLLTPQGQPWQGSPPRVEHSVPGLKVTPASDSPGQLLLELSPAQPPGSYRGHLVLVHRHKRQQVPLVYHILPAITALPGRLDFSIQRRLSVLFKHAQGKPLKLQNTKLPPGVKLLSVRSDPRRAPGTLAVELHYRPEATGTDKESTCTFEFEQGRVVLPARFPSP